MQVVVNTNSRIIFIQLSLYFIPDLQISLLEIQLWILLVQNAIPSSFYCLLFLLNQLYDYYTTDLVIISIIPTDTKKEFLSPPFRKFDVPYEFLVV